MGFGYTRVIYNRKGFPANYSLILHTAEVFHAPQAIFNVWYITWMQGS